MSNFGLKPLGKNLKKFSRWSKTIENELLNQILKNSAPNFRQNYAPQEWQSLIVFLLNGSIVKGPLRSQCTIFSGHNCAPQEWQSLIVFLLSGSIVKGPVRSQTAISLQVRAWVHVGPVLGPFLLRGACPRTSPTTWDLS